MSEGIEAPARPFWQRMERERNQRGWSKLELYEKVREQLGGSFSRMTLDRLRTQKRQPAATTINAIAELLDIPLPEAHVLAGLIEANDVPTEPHGVSVESSGFAGPVPDVVYDPEIARLYEALPPERRELLERVREKTRTRLERQWLRAHQDLEEARQDFAELVRAEVERSQTDEK
ncbi:hypothetical protein Ssi03_25460 [Sphaerisporangium siamense]|uniref:Uncharacterized protein n=1 Tax=Sphaerisporangium siamense TaxID=795645 RepID=A0A7W7D529_9ACTN|nr:hypothetical protein [Sphaerisporangium siamense]MBB4700129.1 hypothetical protein [Sphaerisporangium siamense]GII84556.1 hypothetical protein Ssi03_25460 [Sphaerisporangium siamense]